MRQGLKALGLIIVLFAISGCGFHFQNMMLIPEGLKNLSLQSNDPYDRFSLAMRRQLLFNDVNLVEAQPNVPILRLGRVEMNDEVASVFKQGYEAEKVLSLEVEAKLILPNQQSYMLSAQVSRTFFDNPRVALAKSTEKNMILEEMREQVARQLIARMIVLYKQVTAKNESDIQ